MVKRVLLTSFLFVSVSFAGTGKTNIKFPTFGGKLFWTDVKIANGWRVQENLVTGHYRLLNPKNVRYQWGSRQECLSLFQANTAISTKKKTVFLIHGLGLRKRSLQCLQPILEKQGYQVVNFGYSTFIESIEESSAKLHSVMEEYEGDIYAVTHSMGGILFRQYLKDHPRKIKAIVMLAAPNKGAAIVDALKERNLHYLAGINGKRLTSDCDGLPMILPEPKAPFITVAGVKKNFAGYFPQMFFVEEDNDGLVNEESTQLSTSLGHFKFASSHFTIMKCPEVQQLIVEFFARYNDKKTKK